MDATLRPPGFALRRLSGRALFALACVSLSGIACGASVKEAARAAAPAAVEGGLKEASQPESRRDFAAILQDPRILEASESLSQAVVSGALESMTQPEQLERVGQFSEGLAVRVSEALAKSMSSELGPQISRIAADSVQQALDQVLSTDTEKRVTDFTRALTAAVVQGMTQELYLTDTASGPGAQTVGIQALARQAGHGAALGFQDAVQQTELRRREGEERPGDVLALPARIMDMGLGTITLIGLGLLAVGVTLIAALAYTVLRVRRLRQESQAREDAVVLLASVIKSAEGAPWGRDLRERIREAARDSSAAEGLRSVLRKHSGLRLERSFERTPNEPPVPSSGRMHPAS